MSDKKEKIVLSPKTMENFLVGEFPEKKKQKPEIDEGYLKGKAVEIYNLGYYKNFSVGQIEDILTQIISDVSNDR